MSQTNSDIPSQTNTNANNDNVSNNQQNDPQSDPTHHQISTQLDTSINALNDDQNDPHDNLNTDQNDHKDNAIDNNIDNDIKDDNNNQPIQDQNGSIQINTDHSNSSNPNNNKISHPTHHRAATKVTDTIHLDDRVIKQTWNILKNEYNITNNDHKDNDNDIKSNANSSDQKHSSATSSPNSSAVMSAIDEKAEEEFTKMVHDIKNEPTFKFVEHNELKYRPFKYIASVISRPHLKRNANNNGIKYTLWDDDHQYNYFRYWIGRYKKFRDNAQHLANDLRIVIEREEYDLDNVYEDMTLDNDDDDDDDDSDDDIDSMILSEDEFIKYEWNNIEINEFRLIISEVINILPFYRSWIKLLSECNMDDMTPTIDNECPDLPCKSLKRLLIISQFYDRWIKQNFDDHLVSKHKFHFSVHDFIDGLEHYNCVEFQNDYQHLQHCHLEPINQKTRNHNGYAFGLNVGIVQNPIDRDTDTDTDSDTDSSESDTDSACALNAYNYDNDDDIDTDTDIDNDNKSDDNNVNDADNDNKSDNHQSNDHNDDDNVSNNGDNTVDPIVIQNVQDNLPNKDDIQKDNNLDLKDNDDDNSAIIKQKKKIKKNGIYVRKNKHLHMVTLDVLNRNIYEWFEANLNECIASICPIFERTYRSRYDSSFENNETKYYGLNKKELNDWMEKVAELQYQRIFDAMHTLIFHSSATFECNGFGNSEQHRKFVMLSSQKRQQIRQTQKKSSSRHHKSRTVQLF